LLFSSSDRIRIENLDKPSDSKRSIRCTPLLSILRIYIQRIMPQYITTTLPPPPYTLCIVCIYTTYNASIYYDPPERPLPPPYTLCILHIYTTYKCLNILRPPRPRPPLYTLCIHTIMPQYITATTTTATTVYTVYIYNI
jgi:hypothetical protein